MFYHILEEIHLCLLSSLSERVMVEMFCLLITSEMCSRGASNHQILFKVSFFLMAHIQSLLIVITLLNLWFRGPSDILSVGFFPNRTFIFSCMLLASVIVVMGPLRPMKSACREDSPSLFICDSQTLSPAASSPEAFFLVFQKPVPSGASGDQYFWRLFLKTRFFSSLNILNLN